MMLMMRNRRRPFKRWQEPPLRSCGATCTTAANLTWLCHDATMMMMLIMMTNMMMMMILKMLTQMMIMILILVT